MAKKPAPKYRPPTKAPAKGGRPAGLFTWLAIGLVIIVVGALVIIKVASGGNAGGGPTSFQPADPTTVRELTNVPTSVFNTVGVSSPVAPVTAPLALKGQPELKTTNASGKSLPEVFYIGGEYCPFCAAQRWPTIIALSRFGTWAGLGNMSSYSGDQYPNTPTFTFVRATYKSKYVAFVGVEAYADYLNAAGTNYATLQTPTAAENAILTKYDTPKYIKGLSSSQGNPIPFITYANKFLVSGASYLPTMLAGFTRNQIAAGLSNATSPVTEAIITSANDQTAAICSLTKDQPSNVCTSAGVKLADVAMGLH
ncbi:MAG TPA: DUF929 family protein [Acidimicrobiales bacterium]|nr:DUF929 family protein [Acidimicrobiales bacterium]